MRNLFVSDFIMSISAIMRAEIETLDSIAQNSANTNTPGFKSQRSVLSSETFSALLQSGQNISSDVKSFDASPGKLDVTENPLNLAIVGEGWFLVDSGNEEVLTRNGLFKLDDNGNLVIQQGFPVLGENGRIFLESDNFVVERNGDLLSDGVVIDRLAIYQIDGHAIESIGNGLYRPTGPVQLMEQANILQGALETSNVDTAADMVRLVETTRHIESLQRAIISYDQMIESAISDLGQ